MTWRFHHSNVKAHNVRESAGFYSDVLGMEEVTPPFKEGYGRNRDVAWFEVEGSAQLHISKPMPNFALDHNFHLNPILDGHVAIQVDDIDLVKEKLRARGVYFADAGHWALKDYYQIYTYDPSMNCVEVNMLL